MAGTKRNDVHEAETIENEHIKRVRTSDTTPNRYEVSKGPTFTEKLSETNHLVVNHASSWPRKPLSTPINANTDSISFQWIDIDMYDGTSYSIHAKSKQNAAIIRLYGVTEQGYSVMTHVHNVLPYFYATCPDNFQESDCGTYRIALDNLLSQRERSFEKAQEGAVRVAAVQLVTDKMSIFGYQFDQCIRLLKIYLTMPLYIPKARSILENGELEFKQITKRYMTYESNVPFLLRFLIDQGINGCTWLEMQPKSYTIRPEGMKMSSCQIELDLSYEAVHSHEPLGPIWSKLAPLRILSFDIECMGRKGHFPEPELDPVIQIANVVQLQGSDVPFIRNVFVLKTCKPIVGAHVMEFETEEELIESWAAFVREVDPDILTGYNIDNFDVPYLLNRGKALQLSSYNILGRLKHHRASMEKKSFSSAQYGKSENIKTTIHGRCAFDLLPIMRRSHQLSSYSLNSVSTIFLHEQKEDVAHGIISDLQNGNDEDRHRLAVYCLKDAYLPLRLLTKLSTLVNYIEMARVAGVPIDFLIERGQQIKVFSMLLRKCKDRNLVVPNLPRAGAAGGDANGEGYEGATVIDPKKAFYDVPIATLDFASLYPSIMQAYNLCYSTLVAPQDVGKLDTNLVHKSPSGDVFVTSNVKKGILPLILEELLAARKQAKRDMFNATDPMEKAVQNGRQLALKVSANSVYGFTGANVGQLPCIPIASSVTAYGRQLLYATREEVEAYYTIENGFPANADVVYGDTDSVMVKFGVNTVEESMPLAKDAAARVSAKFPAPIQLEFEKVYFPYLLMNKKRYAGLLWTQAEKYDKLDSKGLETVRRDNCLLVRRMVETILRKILIHRDVPGAISYTKSVIADMLTNKVDISLLVITKGLKKTVDQGDYKVKTAHVELAERMRKRDPGSAPAIGERIAYVIIDKGKNCPLYEKAEDPVYTLEQNIPIDCEYYLKNQLSNPLERIFEPIIGLSRVKSELFHGEHTRKRSKPVLKQNSGGMMNFAVKKMQCLGCKAPLSSGKSASALCQSCLENGMEIEMYEKSLSKVNHLEFVFSRLWTECQNCQGSLHQDVLCTSRDCPIFYKRIKVQKELGEAQKSLDRFKSVDW